MPRCKLTQKTITKLRAPTGTGKPVLYWDAELRGVGKAKLARAPRPVKCLEAYF